MKYWTYEDLGSGIAVPESIIAIAERTLRNFQPYVTEPRLRLVRIGGHDDHCDECAYEVRLELALGVLIDVKAGLLDCDDGDNAETDVSLRVEETLEACMPHVGKLADVVHMARLRARRIVASWQDDGVHGDVIDVHLAPYDHWRETAGPKLVVSLQGLNGHSLQPQVDEVHVGTIGTMEHRLTKYGSGLKELQSERTHFLRLGANGTITQLALNAIGNFGDEEATLRRLASEASLQLPDGTVIRNERGRVRTSSGGRNGRIEWSGEELTIHALSMPAADAFNQSVTEIAKHRYLTDDMLVTTASNEVVDGSPSLKVQLDMPFWLFCSASGRTWRNVARRQAEPVPSPSPSSVVPFPGRRQ